MIHWYSLVAVAVVVVVVVVFDACCWLRHWNWIVWVAVFFPVARWVVVLGILQAVVDADAVLLIFSSLQHLRLCSAFFFSPPVFPVFPVSPWTNFDVEVF